MAYLRHSAVFSQSFAVLNVVMSVFILSDFMFTIILLSVAILSVILLSVVLLGVVMLNAIILSILMPHCAWCPYAEYHLLSTLMLECPHADCQETEMFGKE